MLRPGPRSVLILFAIFSVVLLTLLLMTGGGCESPRAAREPEFGPVKVRIHPTFTQMKDWTGDGRPDGVEAVIELLDEFDEPTRASGRLIFELSDYVKADPESAGHRVVGPWTAELQTRDDQIQHWSGALRSYTFQLGVPKMDPSATYVLSVSFEPAAVTAGAGAGGSGSTRPAGRLFDRVIIEPPEAFRRPEKPIRRSGASLKR